MVCCETQIEDERQHIYNHSLTMFEDIRLSFSLINHYTKFILRPPLLVIHIIKRKKNKCRSRKRLREMINISLLNFSLKHSVNKTFC